MHGTEDGGALSAFLSKIEQDGLPPIIGETFAHYYRKVVSGQTGRIYEKNILPVAPDQLAAADNLSEYTAAGEKVYPKAVRIVLNGGLGTSMGLTGPKSLLEVKAGLRFLDIIIEQARHRGTALAFMNSFNTHSETLAALKEIDPDQRSLVFVQHRFPKILQADLRPAEWPQNPDLEWNPPGHGDVYTALHTSGMLDKLLDQGYVYAFIANSDNLGARMDPELLGYFAENRFSFMMEVARKTAADVKGGHLARYTDGRLVLRESAQCPPEETAGFRDIERYCFFNTNNIWVDLEYVRTLLDREKILHLPMILNPKHLDPRDPTSPRVYQVETAMGAAISLFEGATAVSVPRSRFFPVKTCADLLAARSDLFQLSDSGDLHINPQRKAGGRPETISIELDPETFGKIDQFDNRFQDGVPSLVDCESLTVRGDVRFDRGVRMIGRVAITNSRPTQAVVPEGTIIDTDLIY
jgi:UTP--glucose-1-phosphate uridylyltransferase